MLLSCPLFQSTLPARGATTLQGSAASVLIFQSTLPARGATSARAFALPDYLNFNPRSPHGERPAAGAPRKQRSAISIHAPRTGSDAKGAQALSPAPFQSTLPARGATDPGKDDIIFDGISIPAPRTGSDFNFYGQQSYEYISIHAPRTGSDLPPRGRLVHPDFNPRSPHGERRPSRLARLPSVKISIHAPRTGSDVRVAREADVAVRISIHAPRTGSDLQKKQQVDEGKIFQSTLPARGATRRG